LRERGGEPLGIAKQLRGVAFSFLLLTLVLGASSLEARTATEA